MSDFFLKTMTGMPTWEDLCEDRTLRNLPYKIETNCYGQIVMSPARKEHSGFQGRLAALLEKHLPQGIILTECAVQTTDGVKAADVAWCSRPRWESMSEKAACSVAPEICVEIESWSNTEAEMTEKRALYLEAGAEEFWFCSLQGDMEFFDHSGRVAQSRRCPDFPRQISL